MSTHEVTEDFDGVTVELGHGHTLDLTNGHSILTLAAKSDSKSNVVQLVRKDDVPKMTDVGNAERFAKKYKGKLAFMPHRGMWYEYANHKWNIDEIRNTTNSAIALTKDMINEAGTRMVDSMNETSDAVRKQIVADAGDLAKHAIKSQSKASLEAMLNVAAALPSMVVPNNKLDEDNNLFGVKNGVIELHSCQFRPGKPEDFITRQSVASFGGMDKECPTWEKFFEEVQPDPEVRLWLQKLVGYLISGSVSKQMFPIFHGVGSNGKMVFMETIKRILGSYAATVQFETFTERAAGQSSIRNDLAALDKVRLVIANEGQEGAKLDEGIVKQITGGDDITARFLNKEFFTFKPKFVPVLIANHKPVITGTDNGIWRRVVLVPWPVVITDEKKDDQLVNKLEKEYEGILAWCLHGYSMYIEDGLKLPLALLAANQEYRKDSDVIGMWLSDNTISDEIEFEKTSDIYSDYEQWAKKGGFRPCSAKKLGDRLKERGFVNGKNSKDQRGWYGIKLITPPFVPYDPSL